MHSQYCLSNAEDTNNFDNNFLSDVDFFIAFLHATIYLKVMLNFILKTKKLKKKNEKQALTKQIDIIEIEINAENINILLQIFI